MKTKQQQVSLRIAALILVALAGLGVGTLIDQQVKVSDAVSLLSGVFGAAIGAGLAVLGSIYVSNHEERKDVGRERDILLELVKHLEVNLMTLLLSDDQAKEIGILVDTILSYEAQQVAGTRALIDANEIGKRFKERDTVFAMNKLKRLLTQHQEEFHSLADSYENEAIETARIKNAQMRKSISSILLAARQVLLSQGQTYCTKEEFATRASQGVSEQAHRLASRNVDGLA